MSKWSARCHFCDFNASIEVGTDDPKDAVTEAYKAHDVKRNEQIESAAKQGQKLLNCGADKMTLSAPDGQKYSVGTGGYPEPFEEYD